MTRIDVSPDGTWYIVTFFEGAVEEEVKSNEEKGWKVTTGFLDGEAVPIRAYYRQDMYSLDDVKRFAENLRECPICQRMGQDMSITSINVDNNYNRRVQPEFSGSGMGLNRRQQPAPPMGDVGDMVMNMLFSTLIDTTLTPLGKIFTAKITGNEQLMDQAVPKTNDEMMSLAADFFDSNTPNDMIFRNPDDMKKRAKALRVSITPKEAEEDEKKTPVFRRPQTLIIS